MTQVFRGRLPHLGAQVDLQNSNLENGGHDRAHFSALTQRPRCLELRTKPGRQSHPNAHDLEHDLLIGSLHTAGHSRPHTLKSLSLKHLQLVHSFLVMQSPQAFRTSPGLQTQLRCLWRSEGIVRWGLQNWSLCLLPVAGTSRQPHCEGPAYSWLLTAVQNMAAARIVVQCILPLVVQPDNFETLCPL